MRFAPSFRLTPAMAALLREHCRRPIGHRAFVPSEGTVEGLEPQLQETSVVPTDESAVQESMKLGAEAGICG
jgi:hypothetical protein